MNKYFITHHECTYEKRGVLGFKVTLMSTLSDPIPCPTSLPDCQKEFEPLIREYIRHPAANNVLRLTSVNVSYMSAQHRSEFVVEGVICAPTLIAANSPMSGKLVMDDVDHQAIATEIAVYGKKTVKLVRKNAPWHF